MVVEVVRKVVPLAERAQVLVSAVARVVVQVRDRQDDDDRLLAFLALIVEARARISGQSAG